VPALIARVAERTPSAPLHLIKWSVGIETVEHLAEVQAQRIRVHKGRGAPLRHLTRHSPRRADEIVAAGSIYWVIKGLVQVRQRVLAVEAAAREDGSPAAAIVLDPVLVRTQVQPWRAFQGWRYLEPEKAPADRTGAGTDAELPAALASDLRSLGLI